MKYRLLRSILDFKIGYELEVIDSFGYLGYGDWGHKIPLFIIERNLDWFELVNP